MRTILVKREVNVEDTSLQEELRTSRLMVDDPASLAQEAPFAILEEIQVNLECLDARITLSARVVFADGVRLGLEIFRVLSQEAIASPKPLEEGLAKNAAERTRRLSASKALKVARTGERSDRVALERRMGKHVWDALLSNPKITPPEVATIARKGTVPAPILDRICNNGTWLGASVIRRALLTNPKLSSENAMRVLRRLPKAELKLAQNQRSYTMLVRQQAKKLTGA